jgi:hypothetical protein
VMASSSQTTWPCSGLTVVSLSANKCLSASTVPAVSHLVRISSGQNSPTSNCNIRPPFYTKRISYLFDNFSNFFLPWLPPHP